MRQASRYRVYQGGSPPPPPVPDYRAQIPAQPQPMAATHPPQFPFQPQPMATTNPPQFPFQPQPMATTNPPQWQPQPLLVAEQVSASYGSYRALFGVSLQVPEAGAVALLGSNGAGKSTFARVVTGLLPVTAGTITLAGKSLTNLPAWSIARLGIAHVPEGRGVFSSLTVEENLNLYFRSRAGRHGSSAALQRAYDGFPILAERRKQLAGTLSGGQQRILSLAKVLAVPPRLLVADELSLGLAPVIVDEVYSGLAAIRQAGTALLIVEQQVDRALALADYTVLLSKGVVAWHGPPSGAPAAMEWVLSGGAAASPRSPGNGA